MARFTYRSGNGSEIVSGTTQGKGKADEATPRRITHMHFNFAEDTSAWRVMAYTLEGDEVLVCVATTRDEAANTAKKLAQTNDLPEDAVRLVMQRWKGGKVKGQWIDAPFVKGELPRLKLPEERKPRRSRLVR